MEKRTHCRKKKRVQSKKTMNKQESNAPSDSILKEHRLGKCALGGLKPRHLGGKKFSAARKGGVQKNEEGHLNARARHSGLRIEFLIGAQGGGELKKAFTRGEEKKVHSRKGIGTGGSGEPSTKRRHRNQS